MSTQPPRPRPTHRARVWSRYMLLVLLPLAIWLRACMDQPAVVPGAVEGFSFRRPPQWSYLTETRIKPDGDRIHFDAAAVGEALEQNQVAPLFALTKYPPQHQGLNPVIGVNLAYTEGDQPAEPTDVLEHSVAEVQQRSNDGLEVLEAVNATLVAGRPAARTVLAAREVQPGKVRDRLTVIAIAAGHLSFLIAASGAYEGSDRIDDVLAEFAGSLSLDKP